jgi:hypothetical protein
MAFKVLTPCPNCGVLIEISLSAFFGEGQTDLQKYCTQCKSHFIFIASFSTSLVDQVLINSPKFKVSADCKNFSKAQPQRALNKRIRMWRAIAVASKQLKTIFDIIATEFSSCAVQTDEILALVKETRKRLSSEGVIQDGNPKKGKSGTTSKTAPGEADPAWLSETGGST